MSKDKTISMYPSSISQPNKNERHPIKTWKFLEVRRGGNSYDLGSSSPSDPRYFHGWTNVSELKNGGKAQCGRPSTYFCSHATYYNIKGYRNTCPIAGCNGTYNTPATLQLNLSANALAKKGITDGSEIKSITISFKHRCSGVDVADGREYYNWGPNFHGYDVYPKLNVLELYFTDSDGNRISKKVTTQSNGKKFDNPPLSSTFTKAGTVTAKFTDVTYDEIKNGALNIVYGRNLSTNPGNIYISAPKFEITFNNAKEYITGESNKDELYTSKLASCRTTIQHTIIAGYKSGKDFISINKSPKDITKDDITIKAPKDVSVAYVSKNKRKLKYKITDKSGVAGEKKIKYTIKNSSASVTLKYTAIVRGKPDIFLTNKLKYALSDSEITNELVIKNGCTENIKIYIDSLNTKVAELTTTDFDYSNEKNILKPTSMKEVIKSISSFSCGRHTVYFIRDNEPTSNKVTIPIEIIPRNYQFVVSMDITGKYQTYHKDDNQQKFDLIQSQSNHRQNVYIKRVDNEQPSISPTFSVTESTSSPPIRAPLDFSSAEEQTITIQDGQAGYFYISITEDNSLCTFRDIREINFEPYHQQNHDFIYVRGEDSTSFDYKYIVGWEGDNYREPIDVSDIQLICQYDDIKICANEENITGISKSGYAPIKISNKSPYHKDFTNIRIELNVLRKNEEGELEVTTDEFFELDGMLLNLVENFDLSNSHIANNVSIVNLSPDNDIEDEENVYIHIKELKYDDTIVINLPFVCRTDKEIYIQLLILGQPMQIYPFLTCEGDGFDYIKLQTYDSILTNMNIEGNMDILSPDINHNYLTGASQDQCPNECFITKKDYNRPWNDENNGGIKYTIQNIDSNTIGNAQTIIHNDENLIPFGFLYYTKNENGDRIQHSDIIGDDYTPNTDNKVYWLTTNQTKRVNIINGIIYLYVKFPNTEEEIIIKRTDANGDAKFFIDIPEHLNTKYTMSTLLTDVITFYYEGNTINKECMYGKINTTISEKQSVAAQKTQERLSDLRTAQTQFNSTSTQYKNISSAIHALETDDRNQVYISHIDDYRRYKPGQGVEINIHVESELRFLDNNIIFNADIQNPGDIDELTVFYKVCNLENNIGILNTEFKTKGYTLIPNSIDKNIYLGVDTKLYPKVSIEKRIVEQNTLNVLHIYLFNELRDNKDVVCIIDLGIYPNEQLFGSYNFIDIDIDAGDYNIVTKEEQYNDENNESVTYQHLFIEWHVGEMLKGTNYKATVIIKGDNVGLSEILIDTYDYLHDGTNHNYHFGEYLCDCR